MLRSSEEAEKRMVYEGLSRCSSVVRLRSKFTIIVDPRQKELVNETVDSLLLLAVLF